MWRLNVIALCFELITLASIAQGGSLVATSVIFRHGDRAPTGSLPIDRYNESFWPSGYGQLTDIGKKQHYELGQLLRKQYNKLLLNQFYYENIEVLSSDVDRCLVSAYSDLAGLYANQTEKEDLQLPFMRWQPVPVHTQPVKTDDMLAMQRKCNLATATQILLMNSPTVQQINEDYADMYALVSNETGVNLSINGLAAIFMVQDTLLCEYLHGAPLPEWTQGNVTCNGNTVIPCDGKTVWDVMTDMKGYQFYQMYNSSVVQRFDGGPLLLDISTKFNEFASGNRTIKFTMYSGHDTTLTATLSALGVVDWIAPEYASAILIELHHKDSDYHVQFYRKNETDSDTIYPLEIPGCPTKCTLTNFTAMLEQYVIDDWDTACHNNPSHKTTTPSHKTTTHSHKTTTHSHKTTTHSLTTSTTSKPNSGLSVGAIIGIVVGAVCLVILIIVAVICVVKRKRPNAYQAID